MLIFLYFNTWRFQCHWLLFTSREQITEIYVLIISNLIWYLKEACPTTECYSLYFLRIIPFVDYWFKKITSSLKLKAIPTRSVASNRTGKRTSQNIRKVQKNSSIWAWRLKIICKSAHALWLYKFLFKWSLQIKIVSWKGQLKSVRFL